MRDSRRAPDITIDNDTPYDLTIKVSDAAGEVWMGFALVNAHSVHIVRATVDHGAVWILSYGLGGEYSIDRSALQEAGWRIRVPDRVPARLAAAGIAPSPQRNRG